MPVRLRNNPFSFTSQLLNLREAGKVSKLPPWFAAMQLHPPAPKPLRSVIPSEVGQFERKGARESLSSAQFADAVSGPSRSRQASRAAARGTTSMWATAHAVRAPRIVYEEDEIRQVFFRRHPLELDRARIIADNEATLGTVVWSTIRGGDANVPLSGESVVQRTLYLMRGSKPMSRHLAYKQALSEFYQARAEEERIELAAREQAVKAGALAESLADATVGGEPAGTAPETAEETLVGRKYMQTFMREEEQDLAESRDFNKSMLVA
nr:mitochondrial ribosomal small subunit component [Polyrhizophydium stewartii]